MAKFKMSEWEANQTRRTLSKNNLEAYTNNLMGIFLTAIDAGILDSKQNKAIKDLVRRNVWSTFDLIGRWSDQQTNDMGSSFPLMMSENPPSI